MSAGFEFSHMARARDYTFKCLLIKYSSLFANFSLFTRGQMHEGKFKFILAAQNEFMKLDQANSYLVQIDLFSSCYG